MSNQRYEDYDNAKSIKLVLKMNRIKTRLFTKENLNYFSKKFCFTVNYTTKLTYNIYDKDLSKKV